MSNTLDAILSQYEKNTEPTKSGKKISSEDRLKKYFSEKLPKGVKSHTKTFRILPKKDGSSPFTEVYYHEKLVNGNWDKIYCNQYFLKIDELVIKNKMLNLLKLIEALKYRFKKW